MTRVLDFWRDVEIFNIPEVPTGAKPGRPNAAAAADTAQYQGIDLDEDNAELPDSESSIRPRSRLLQRFGIDLQHPGKPVVPSGMPRMRIEEAEGQPVRLVPASCGTEDSASPPAAFPTTIP
jgi:hypothetical protein